MKYNVTIKMQALTYDGIEADTMELAESYALDMVYDENMYDLLKWADIEGEEVHE